ncbi:MAG: hypothetical protein AAFN91_12335 [Pseudomonadota bacterium]
MQTSGENVEPADKGSNSISPWIKWPVVIYLLGWFVWIAMERNFYHNRVPAQAGIGSITYLNSKTWGFGPGGNETAVVVFKLKQKTTNSLESSPIQFLDSLPRNDRRGYRCRNYSGWTETPFLARETDRMVGTVAGKPITLDAMLNRYGFKIRVPNRISSMIDDAFASEGSYYGGSRCGFFIFVPQKKRGAYIFVG